MQKIDLSRLEKLKNDLSKIASIEHLKKEVQRITNEIKADVNARLAPHARENIKKIEKKYKDLVQSLGHAQKQFEADIKKAVNLVKNTRKDLEKRVSSIKTSKKPTKKSTTKKVAKKVKKKATAESAQ